MVNGSIPPGHEADWSKVIISITDVTERKQAEEKLRASEERYHSLFQHLVDGFALHEIITDDQGKPVDYRFLEINPAFERLTGLRAETTIGRRVNEILPRVGNERFISIYGNVALTGEAVHFEEYSAPLGKYYEINAYSPRRGQVAITFEDITERKQAETELRKLSRAVDQSASTIVITDMQGKIEYVNPKFTEITGYTFEEAIGQNPRMLKTGHTPAEEYKHLWKTITAGEEWRGELFNRKKNGDLFWEQVTISPIQSEQGEITHFIAVKEDISQRKQSEAEIQRHLVELQAVYENGLAVGQLLEPRQIGERLIETFARHLSWHHVTIRLLRPQTDELELIAFNLPDLDSVDKAEVECDFSKLIHKAGQGLSGHVVQTGTPIRTGQVHAHPQYISTQAGIESGLYMPLKIGDRITGVISVESEKPDAFSEQDERLLATLATQAAVAFENARLYQAAQQEIAERQRAQEALRVSETHYRELADSITEIMFELDQDLRYTYWNRASEMFSGIPAQNAIGRSIRGVFGESEDQSHRESIYRRVLTEQQAQTFETEVFPQAQRRILEINAYPSARGVSVVAKDITERRLSEALQQKRIALMEYSARHSLGELMQRAIDEISELTDSHIGFLHFVEADQKAVHLQAWSSETIQLVEKIEEKGMHYPVESAGVWAEAVRQRRAIIHDDYESLPNKNGLPEGHVQVIRELVVPIIRDDRVAAVLGIGNRPRPYDEHDIEITERFADYAWDIIERKQMESALSDERNQLAKRVDERTADLSRANSNLARALRVKDEFLANMSHELRTPLNAILGLSESLSEQVAGPLNEKQQKYLNTINESGHHLLSLINDILDLAKIEAGQISLDINKVDVNSVCQASLRMIKQLAQKKNQEVLFEIDSGLGLMWADERRLKQMMVNLLSNAVKFTPENGKLGLEVHGDQAGNRVLITVWDRGIGISDQDLDRLFRPFVQLDSGLAREATGTGLGLALVAQMARLHGGSVNVDSHVGEGSRFTIQLPWEPALTAEVSNRLRTSGKFRAIDIHAKNKPTILLIEDTREVVMMLADYLEMAGFIITTAQDGIEGLEQAKLKHPDLILMDIQMPRMDGFETTQKLRMIPEFKDTPIIALTALAMPNDRQRCLDAGMSEYISKPVNLKMLLKVIRSILYEKEGKAT
jgi:PAS domain S-box-containing protein